jgi:hypothetical protein
MRSGPFGNSLDEPRQVQGGFNTPWQRRSQHRIKFGWNAIVALCALLASVALAACGDDRSPVTTTTTQHHHSPSPHITLSLYWIRDGEALGVSHRSFPKTESSETVALDALLSGPSQTEVSAGLSSAVPKGTKLLGLSTKKGITTANFNSTFASGGGSFSVRARIAQVVFTLTQFTSVKTVLVELNGVKVNTFSSEGLILDQPLSRASQQDLLPPIFLEEPAVGDTIHSPLYLAGLSNTFEAVFQVQVIDSQGHIVADQQVRATAGTGTWGSFEVRLHLNAPSGPGKIVAFEMSPKDGSHIHQIQVPVTIAG